MPLVAMESRSTVLYLAFFATTYESPTLVPLLASRARDEEKSIWSYLVCVTVAIAAAVGVPQVGITTVELLCSHYKGSSSRWF